MRHGCWQTGVKKMNWNETFGPGHQWRALADD